MRQVNQTFEVVYLYITVMFKEIYTMVEPFEKKITFKHVYKCT